MVVRKGSVVRVLPVKNSKLVKWKVRVETSGGSYIKSYHKKKNIAKEVADKLRRNN